LLLWLQRACISAGRTTLKAPHVRAVLTRARCAAKTTRHAQAKLFRFLDFPVAQHPLVLQLGGSDPASLAAAARTASRYGYDELNLNCGCPSPKVAGAGCFGAALMTSPERVAHAVAAMADASGLPVTVKCRTGVDDADSYSELCAFVEAVSARGGVRHVIVHARKALLNGLSPEDNRRVPPLRYELVLALARDFPHLSFTLNGGLDGLPAAAAALRAGGGALAGAMLGRAPADRPWDILGDADRTLYGVDNPAKSRREVVAAYCAYADAAQADGRFGRDASGACYPTTRSLVRPLLNLFSGAPRGRAWRAAVDGLLKADAAAHGPRRGGGAVTDIVMRSLATLPDEALDAPPPDARAAAGARELTWGPLPPPRGGGGDAAAVAPEAAVAAA
jgi:tRNA-dihydrouridine synthase A